MIQLCESELTSKNTSRFDIWGWVLDWFLKTKAPEGMKLIAFL
jgi:hypothetical protein